MIARVRNRLGRAQRSARLGADLRALRRTRGDVFRPLRGEQGVALIVSLSDFVYQVKTEGMLAQGIAREGLSPIAVVPSWPDRAREYFDFFGVRTTTLGAYAEPGDEELARAETSELLERELDVASLMELELRNTEVGRHVLSTVSRSSTKARSTRASRAFASAWSGSWSTRPLDDRGRAAARRSRPGARLFNERNYAAEAPLSDIALGARHERRPVRLRVPGRRARLQAIHARDEAHAPALGSRTSRGDSSRDAVDRARRRLLDEELRARYDGSRWGLARATRTGRRSGSRRDPARARARSVEEDRGRVLPRAVGREHVLRARTCSRTRRNGSSRLCAPHAQTTASTGS